MKRLLLGITNEIMRKRNQRSKFLLDTNKWPSYSVYIVKNKELTETQTMTQYNKQPVTEQQIQNFVDRAQCMIDQDHNKLGNVGQSPKLEIMLGKVRAKICTVSAGQGRSAWAFVDFATGDILKPASWSAPAKHARGNINTPTDGVEFVGPYGPAYLR